MEAQFQQVLMEKFLRLQLVPMVWQETLIESMLTSHMTWIMVEPLKPVLDTIMSQPCGSETLTIVLKVTRHQEILISLMIELMILNSSAIKMVVSDGLSVPTDISKTSSTEDKVGQLSLSASIASVYQLLGLVEISQTQLIDHVRHSYQTAIEGITLLILTLVTTQTMLFQPVSMLVLIMTSVTH